MIAINLVKINSINQSTPFKLRYLLREYNMLFIQFSMIWIASVISVVLGVMFVLEKLSPIYYHVFVRSGAPWVVVVVFGLKKVHNHSLLGYLDGLESTSLWSTGKA
ncbi:hypothetical protein E1B28_002834 [Marasmius oreades]|uniref:Uncharacterized protein n=1 Tax=Marasmius oreades TaxID=181124 RepID=A0A9P7RPE5_9AGAR|nr:uncharacterized protein E1B28_002834 [Marasmius oreades]KAG7086918.1 hypothetical protein E1B28_002834 [Marasmius oreades]